MRRGEEGGYEVQQRGETVMMLWNEEEEKLNGSADEGVGPELDDTTRLSVRVLRCLFGVRH